MTATLVDVPPYGTPDWVAARRRGVGASEVSTLAGVNPWGSEYALAAEKRGDVEPDAETPAMRWGHVVEALALDFLEREQGIVIVRGETFADPRWPHLWATLDGRHDDEGYEVKATRMSWPGDEPPQHVQVQALCQMGLADLARVHVVKVSPYGEPIVHTVERDDALIVELLDLSEAWYVRYVLGNEMPPVDGSRGTSRALDRLRGFEEAPANEWQTEMAGRLRNIRKTLDTLEEQKRAIENALKQSMAGTGRLVGPGFRIDWQAVKGRRTVDWRAVADEYRELLPPLLDLDDIEKRHTTTGEDGTRFVPRFDEEGQS